MASAMPPAPPASTGRTDTLVVASDSTVVCHRCVVADRFSTRLRGLLGRPALPAGEGLLLRPCSSVHMAFMRFPIDVVFLDAGMQVVDVVESLRPWRAAAARGARMALELAAGEVGRHGIAAGARLRLVEEGPGVV